MAFTDQRDDIYGRHTITISFSYLCTSAGQVHDYERIIVILCVNDDRTFIYVTCGEREAYQPTDQPGQELKQGDPH